jgi:hypothetical protein
VPIGAGIFIVALAISAAVVPAIRPLHVFQALIYVAVILLARRNSAWGLGAGTAVAVAWNILQFFVTGLMQTGVVVLLLFLRTGQLRRLDTMMVTLGWFGHCVLIASCVAAFMQHRPDRRAWQKFLVGGALALTYFACIIATLLPR